MLLPAVSYRRLPLLLGSRCPLSRPYRLQKFSLRTSTFGRPRRLSRATPAQAAAAELLLTPGWIDLESRNTSANALGDLDNDGDLDLVTGAYGAGVRLFVNHAGRMAPALVLDQGVRQNVFDVALGDLNRDGKLDIIVANGLDIGLETGFLEFGTAAYSRVYLNDTVEGQALQFSPAENVLSEPLAEAFADTGANAGSAALIATAANAVATGDLDGDAWLDIVFATNRGLYLLRNLGAAVGLKMRLEPAGIACVSPGQNRPLRSQEPAWRLDLGDMDGDGDLDLAAGYGSNLELWMNEGDCFSPLATYFTAGDIAQVAWGDANRDGCADLAVGQVNAPTFVIPFVIPFEGTDQTAACRAAADWWFVDAGVLESEEVRFRTVAVDWGDADGDGLLDLALGSGGETSNRIFRNTGAGFAYAPFWSDSVTHETTDLRWGDVDNDGDLDLFAAIYAEPDFVYVNRARPWIAPLHSRSARPPCRVLEADGPRDYVAVAQSVALGDVDGDDDLDVAVGYVRYADCFQPDRNPATDIMQTIYEPCWDDARNAVFENRAGVLQPTPLWESDRALPTVAVAWGDVDADGDLDLVSGNVYGPLELTRNVDGQLETTPSCTAMRELWLGWPGAPKAYYVDDPVRQPDEYMTDIALADVNRDGYLDVVAGIFGGPDRLYYFAPQLDCFVRGGWLPEQGDAAESAYTPQATYAVAFGDVDGDGDLDLAVGNSWDQATATHANRDFIYLNERGILANTPYQVIGERALDDRPLYGFPTRSLAWGDMDGDGAPDLAASTWSGQQRVYRNVDGRLLPAPVWESADSDLAPAVAWADADGDGDLDLAVATVTLFSDGTRNKLYLNDEGMLNSTPDWQSVDTNQSLDLAWGDLNGDGAQDLLFANQHAPLNLYPGLRPAAAVAGQAAAVRPSFSQATLPGADFFAAPQILASPIISIPYTLLNSHGQAFQSVRAYFTPNGADRQPAAMVDPPAFEPDANATGTDLDARNCPYAAGEHIFPWQTTPRVGPALYGQSDSVSVRLEALPCYAPTANAQAGSYQWAMVSAQSYPFRVRGRQVRVVNEAGVGLANARVDIRDPQQTRAQAIADLNGAPMLTDAQGYLEGWEALEPNARLFALWPAQQINVPYDAQLYLTSEPSADDATFHQLGSNRTDTVEELVVNTGAQLKSAAAQRPLLLFDLTVALEWDVSADPEFMTRLDRAFQQASDVVYDVTDGQVALGDLRVYQNGENWEDADIVIYASNAIHPRATMGGVVKWDWADAVLKAGGPERTLAPAVYVNGQIRMGPNWDPLDLKAGDLEQDWWRALAHELGHYLLFLPDNYLGVDERNVLKPTNCVGSLMTDAYDEEQFGELLTAEQWVGDCLDTVGEKLLFGRDDRAQVVNNLPIRAPTAPCLAGESCRDQRLPVAVTRLCWMPSDADAADVANAGRANESCLGTDAYRAMQTQPKPLPARRFMILNDAGDAEFVRGAQAYLFSTVPGDAADQRMPERVVGVTALGATSSAGNSILVRGAQPGDMLCVFDWQAQAPQIGCKKLTAQMSSVTILPVAGWEPEITVTPVSSVTMEVTMPRPPALESCRDLEAQVIPAYVGRHTVAGAQPTGIMRDGAAAGSCAVTLTATSAAAEGYVRVWDKDAPFVRTALTQYFLSPGWGPNSGGFSPANPGNWGPNSGGFSPTNPGGWGPNSGGFSPTNPGGWGPNSGGFSPTNPGGWGPNSGGFSPTNSGGWGPNSGGFSPTNPAAGGRIPAASVRRIRWLGTELRRLQSDEFWRLGAEFRRLQSDELRWLGTELWWL